MSEVSDVAIKRTQDSLGKIIKKPVLTEKLLRKPPFKFLHDIIHAVIDTTGFLDGLYTEEELKSENIKDRDSKIAFLQKAVDTLKIATKQEVRARPSKIVAGLEADKTNELLLAIAKAIDRKVDSSEAVALVKSGNAIEPSKKEPKPSKTQAQNKTETRKPSKDSKEPSGSKKVKNSAGADKKPQNDRDGRAKVSKQSSKDSTDVKKTKTKTKSLSPEKEKPKDNRKERESKIQKKDADKTVVSPKQVITTSDVPKTNGIVQNGAAMKQNNEEIEQHDETVVAGNGVFPNDESSHFIEQFQKDLKVEQVIKIEDTEKPQNVENVKENEKLDKHDKSPEKIAPEIVQPEENRTPKASANVEKEKEKEKEKVPPEPMTNGTHSAASVQEKAPNEKPRSSKSKKHHSKNEVEKISDGVNGRADEKLKSTKSVDKLIERPLVSTSKPNDHSKESKPPRTALRSAAVRPISARPSAPRRRDRNVRQILHTESFVQESTDQNKPDKKNSMPEFDDADNIVITETISDNVTAIDDLAENRIDDGEINGKQGHLVQQILETQTAILKSDTKNDVLASEESILNDRKSITRNMAELRKMIQKLSLYITPLGKMMEYFQEDVDAMQIELMMWQKAGTAAEADIKEEQRTTEKLLENFKYQLAEINNSIKDHAEQINNTTMNIIQNEEKISKLITML